MSQAPTTSVHFQAEHFSWAAGAFELRGRWSGDGVEALGRVRLLVNVDGRRRNLAAQDGMTASSRGRWTARFACSHAPDPGIPAALKVAGRELPLPAADAGQNAPKRTERAAVVPAPILPAAIVYRSPPAAKREVQAPPPTPQRDAQPRPSSPAPRETPAQGWDPAPRSRDTPAQGWTPARTSRDTRPPARDPASPPPVTPESVPAAARPPAPVRAPAASQRRPPAASDPESPEGLLASLRAERAALEDVRERLARERHAAEEVVTRLTASRASSGAGHEPPYYQQRPLPASGARRAPVMQDFRPPPPEPLDNTVVFVLAGLIAFMFLIMLIVIF